MRLDHIAYRVADKEKTAQFFIDFMGYKLTTPYNYKEYLTAKYGNWSVQVKKWHCKDDEKTIVG